jgi:hypothetical protein
MGDASNTPGFSFYTQTCGSPRSAGMRVVTQLLVFVLAIFTTLTCSWASLGDNYEKVEDSYGSIAERRLRDDRTVSILYHKDRYLYLVIFADGQSVSETYFHVKGTDLSEREISKFLKANGAGATWTSTNRAKERRFKRSDGKAEATYGDVNGRPALTVRDLRAKP